MPGWPGTQNAYPAGLISGYLIDSAWNDRESHESIIYWFNEWMLFLWYRTNFRKLLQTSNHDTRVSFSFLNDFFWYILICFSSTSNSFAGCPTRAASHQAAWGTFSRVREVGSFKIRRITRQFTCYDMMAFPWHFTYWGTTVVESSDFYFEITR